MTEVVKERSKAKIPSVFVTEDLLRDLCDVLDKEFASNASERFVRLEYHSEGKNKDYTTTDSSQFIKNSIQKDTQYLRLRFYSSTKDIDIWLGISGYRKEFEVSGNEPIWVAGITKRLEEIFEKHKSSHGPLYTASWLWVIFVSSSVILGFAYWFVFYQAREKVSEGIFLAVVFSAGSAFGILGLLRWLYPDAETKFMRRVKARKAILAVIGTIVLGIVGNYAWQYLPK